MSNTCAIYETINILQERIKPKPYRMNLKQYHQTKKCIQLLRSILQEYWGGPLYDKNA